jgi:hypothetical protein
MSVPGRIARGSVPRLVGICMTMLAPSPGPAEEPPTRQAPAAAGTRVDRASEAIRREAEANARERNAAFARIRAIPAPAPQLQVMPIIDDPLLEVVDTVDETDEDLDEKGDVAPRQRMVYTEDAFEQIVLDGITVERARTMYTVSLERRIAEASQRYRLGPRDQARLRLAGTGAIKRYLAPVEAKREEWKLVRMDIHRARQFLSETRYLRSRADMALGDESLYAKALNKIVGDQKPASASATDRRRE